VISHCDLITPVKSAFTKFGYVFLVWTGLALLQTSSEALYRALLGAPIGFFHVLRHCLLDYWLWAALTPIVFYLARRFPFTRSSWPRATTIHFGFYLLLTFAHEVLASLVGLPSGAPPSFHGSVLGLRFVSSLYNDLWMYWPIVVVWSMLHYYECYRERDTRAAQLKEQLSRAELQALRNQLHPHFLFNTLNSVASLMHEDVEAADDMLADLSHLLRVYLAGNDQQETPLRQEMELLDTYIRIQKRRFEGRLSVVFDIPTELLDAAVPSLLLQPLVENSILHGIAPRSAPGYVRVTAHRQGSALQLEISDNGLGLPGHHVEGIGLSNTRSRLRQLYENRQTFSIFNSETGGVTVSISLPLRMIPASSDDHTNPDHRRRTARPAADSVVAQIR
jgi:two-component system, LytTR family, sensor kinase